MKRMLFNATQAEELRVAIVDGQKLIDLDIESASKEQRKSNIYKGVITRIEPSLEACFVDYGAERHGFLPFKEVSRSYFQPGVEVSRARINEALKEGQEVIVQVDKDERGNKGAALTTYVSLAGRYLVLMPNNPRGGGVSRRVDGDDRAELRDAMDQLEVPNGMSMIARTAAIGRQAEELQWDLNYLLQLWRAIEGVSNEMKAPLLIYQEGSLVIRAIRDYFQPEIGEILIDTDDVYEQARAFMEQVMPNNVNRVKRYRDDVPLFSRFQIEHQIETAFGRQVNLPSGGAIVIDHTEALVAIDVNSGRATKGADIEETATKTNQEAADEIARQLRLRDLGGLIVIDFIDMENQRNQREVENRLKDALRFDRARVQMGKISRFGLMELSRQRLRPALAETSYIPCPRCSGTGHIRSTESAALHILRILEEEAMKDNTAAVHTQVPVDVATFLLNEKRQDIQAIELRHKVTILLIPNTHLETPAHSIVRLRHDELNQEDIREPSYRLVELPSEDANKPSSQQDSGKPRQEAAIKNISPAQPAPTVAEKPAAAATPEVSQGGLFSKIFSWFRGEPKVETPVAPAKPERKPREGQRDGARRDRNEGNRRGGRSNNRRDEGGERNESRGRNNEQRGERKERQAPAAAESAPREAANPRQQQERRPRGERKERQPRPPAEHAELNATEQVAVPVPDGAVEVAADQGSAAPAGDESGSRRRGRRGGRGRGERRPDAQAGEAEGGNNAGSAEALVEPVTAAAFVPVADQAQANAENVEAVVVKLDTPAPVVESAAPLAPTSEPAAAAATPAAVEAEPIVVETPVPAPVAAVAAAAPAPAPVETVDLGKVLEESGLVLVQTTAPVTSATAEPPPQLGRPRRRQATDTSADEPMVMIETGK